MHKRSRWISERRQDTKVSVYDLIMSIATNYLQSTIWYNEVL